MFGRIRHIAMMSMLLFALSSCDKTIHEYPGDCNITLNVECGVDLTHPEHFITVECDAENGTSYVVRTQSIDPLGTRFTEPVCLRYVIDLYRVTASHSVFVERQVLFAEVENPIPEIASFEVQAAQYKVLVWCDYVQDDVREAWYYSTDDLRKIVYSDVEVVDNNDKDVFSNCIDVDLTEYYYLEGEFVVDAQVFLERPKGSYKCITTDLEDYLMSDEGVKKITSVITYVQYVSAGYNVEEQKPNYFEPTRTYITTTEIDALSDDSEDGNKLELFYDYVFVNGKQTNVKLNFAFYKDDITINSETGEIIGDKISEWTGIVVPLKRNMETVIDGRLLTTSFGTGGIGIDPGFEDEIVIPWED